MTESTWTCGGCGRSNMGAFCGRCGNPRSAEAPIPAPEPFIPSAETTVMSAVQAQPIAPPTHAAPGAPASEAPGISLMPGETAQLDVSFSPHLFLQHLRTRVLLTDRRIVVQSPHTLFGIFPMGYANGSAPLDAIDQINHGHMMRSNRVLGGTIAAFVGIAMLLSGSFGPLIAVLLFGVAGLMFATARITGIFFDTGGNHLLAAAGRGKDIASVQSTAQRVIEAIQAAHEGHPR